MDGVHKDFIIVHHKPASPRKGTKNGCSKYDHDCDLKSFLGVPGQIELLSLIDNGPYHNREFKNGTSDIRKWVEFYRRLQLPFYEEARQYWNVATADGYFGDVNSIRIYMADCLKSMIEHYENELR